MEEIKNCRSRLAIVLPSLDPDKKFQGVVEGLVANGFEHIVIVDDGSDAGHKHFFAEAAKLPQAHLCVHEVNRGKGRALKTGFEYVINNLPELDGVITIDGDGQHLVEDIIACGERMLVEEDKVVLGCRDFDQPGVPPRSVAGNKTTSRFFKILFNIKLSDTQTGLRAIPARYLADFCAIEGERFEYETNMLLNMKRMGIDFAEQSIATVYDPDDYSSHYNAVKDSMRIFKVMMKFLTTGSGFRYIISALLSWVVDNGLYLLMLTFAALRFTPVLASTVSQIVARVLSSFFNFNMNDRYVFRSKENYWKAMGKYYCVCVPQTFVSVVCLTALISALGITVPIIATGVKVLLELLLFVISYYIQNKWVFNKK